MRRLEFGRCDRFDAVLEVEARDLPAHTVEPGTGTTHAVAVLRGWKGERSVVLLLDELPPGVLVERRVDLEELTGLGAVDGAGLATVQDLLAVLALQAEGDPFGEDVRQRGEHEDQQTQRPCDVVDGKMEL